MFQDLMPISDDYVRYQDFETFQKRSEWRTLTSKMSAMISKTLEAIKAHRHLTDQGLQVRAREDLKQMIKDGNRRYKELKKKLSNDREERLIREAIDDASTDSEGEQTRKKM